MDFHRKAGLRHLQVVQLGLDGFGHRRAGAAACGRKRGSLRADFPQEPRFFRLQLRDVLLGVADGVQFFGSALAIGDDLFNGVAVLCVAGRESGAAALRLAPAGAG